MEMENMTTQFRIEKDSLGEVQVPCDALYGVQTVRATQNFPITHLRTHPAMIRSLGMIKRPVPWPITNAGIWMMRGQGIS